jgi:integrase/recombinase XerD
MSITSIKVQFRDDRNKWQVSYWLDGKRKRPLFESKQEALNFARRLRLGETVSESNSIPLSEAIQSYKENESEQKASSANEPRYFNLLFHFMTVERGVEHLGNVTLQDLEAFQRWLLVTKLIGDEPLKMGASTVNRAFHSYRHFFKKQVQWGNLPASPCIYLDNLETEENERRAMTRAEFDLAYAQSPEWFKSCFRFIFLTGAPPICVERLTWSDVDLVAGSYRMRRRKGPKAKWKVYSHPITGELLTLLLAQRERFQDRISAVFRNESGKPLKADWCSKIGNRAIKSAGLEGVVLYGLRHGLATDLTDANVATEVVRQIMGHASISTTQRYAKRAKLETLSSALTIVRGGLESPGCHQEKETVASGDSELVG